MASDDIKSCLTEEACEAARRMLTHGEPVEKIVEYTGLSEDSVEYIRTSFLSQLTAFIAKEKEKLAELKVSIASELSGKVGVYFNEMNLSAEEICEKVGVSVYKVMEILRCEHGDRGEAEAASTQACITARKMITDDEPVEEIVACTGVPQKYVEDGRRRFLFLRDILMRLESSAQLCRDIISEEFL